MTFDDLLSLGLGISAFAHVLCGIYIVLCVKLIKHQKEQILELTNVVGDAVAAAYLKEEERQERLLAAFGSQHHNGETD